jgi:hypothetical protein
MTEPQRNEEHQAPSVPAKPAPKLVMKGLYPPGGPKIVRQEYERLGFQWVPPNTPNGIVVVPTIDNALLTRIPRRSSLVFIFWDRFAMV